MTEHRDASIPFAGHDLPGDSVLEESAVIGQRQPGQAFPDKETVAAHAATRHFFSEEAPGPDALNALFQKSSSAAEYTEGEPESAHSLDDIPRPPDDPELVRLRDLLFKREILLINKLLDSQDDPKFNARRVSRVLAEAIVMREKSDSSLSIALEPTVDEIIQTSLRKRQNDFVNALFPLMGPTIRRSIAEAFRSMLGNFSKSVEMAFSWKGLRWRFEAIRSGKPFSEIVLLHTLLYRVEQIFFIHSETGLILSHIINEGAGSQDADMVSAMLTAIQDFVRDCFSGGSGGDLESLHLGDSTIMIEKSPQAYLACVVRGTPPSGFREQLRTALELMLIEFADPLADFSGDSEPFAGSERYLSPFLVSRYVDESRKIPLWAKLLPFFVLLAVAGGALFFSHQHERLKEEKMQRETAAREQRQAFETRMRDGLSVIRTEPGIMVVNVSQGPNPPWEVTAFKDVLARDPKDILTENGIGPELFAFRLVPFLSFDPAIILKRVEQAVAPPPSVSMKFEPDGTLIFSGTAPMSWILDTRNRTRFLPGVNNVNMQNLHDPQMEKIAILIKEVEDIRVEFALGKDLPIPADQIKLEKAVDTLVKLEKLAGAMGLSLSLTIYGHADTVGSEKRNYEISQDRARTVAAMLYARGSSMPVSIYGMGSEYPKNGESPSEEQASRRGNQASRRIEMRVHLTRPATAGLESFH